MSVPQDVGWPLQNASGKRHSGWGTGTGDQRSPAERREVMTVAVVGVRVVEELALLEFLGLLASRAWRLRTTGN